MKFFISCLALAGISVAVFAGCGGQSSSDSDGDGYTIAVIPKGLGHQFWLTVKAGADAAGNDLDAKIVWNGPAKETEIAEQIDIVHDMISRNVDAIVLAACDENALVSAIQAAVDAGIPVVTIDSGVKSDLPISFVATDNLAGAKLAADATAELIGKSGEVGVLPMVPGAATSELRENGFKKGIAEYADITVVATLYSQSDSAKAMAAVEDMMTANPELDAVFSGSESGAIGAAQAIESAGKAGVVKLVSFDASEEQIAALKRGSIQALIVQSPFRMGYDGVKTAIDYLEGRAVDERVDTGVTVVTLDNLNDSDVQKLLNPL